MADMDLNVLEDAARECGKLIVRMREEGITATDKDDVQGSHFVTEADIKSQALGIEIVHRKFPDEVFVAEEDDYAEVVPADCTVMDPVDGTTIYYNGVDDFGVTLCTIRDGQPVMGVINIPRRNIFLSCEKGKGVWLNGKQLPPFNWKRPIDKTVLGMDIGPWSVLEIVERLLKAGFPVRSAIAAVYSASEIILGKTGVYVHPNGAKIWDAAAGSLMVQELGGITMDMWGKPVTWNKVRMGWAWAVNQELADALLPHTRPQEQYFSS